MHDRVIMSIPSRGNKQVLNSTLEIAALRMIKLQIHRFLNGIYSSVLSVRSLL